ncbi:alpha-glucan family phosphorylase [Acidipropionibacterium jensenii]|nr:alpha-glucan family phosphorylase [Acidipropionibacterium jensenii]AZZ42065.1 alpha-glucan family phosphorylase [Acidipropionibacterium jensenii]
MRAIRRFIVQPVLPEPLKPLSRLATNLRWSWNLDTRALFGDIDPALWEEVDHDPFKLLARTPSDRLDILAHDKRFLRRLELTVADLDEYLTGDLWFQKWAKEHPEAPRTIGYFSAEFGITKVLPQYSGGLGILAGDHLKAASDNGVPIIGVGLFYRHGYFRQSLNASGWQQERYPVLDANEMPVTQLRDGDDPVLIPVQIFGNEVKAQVWVVQVGRVPLLMLDTDIDANPGPMRGITDQLYGGDAEHRLVQEVLLGVGGMRALREYCRVSGHAVPEVYHANEGHAGFLGLERIREYMETGDDFDTALERTRAGNVFTTHTPVPAGIDRFPIDRVRDQFSGFGPLPIGRVLDLGRETYQGGDPGIYNMAVLGFRAGQRANGVSELHGEVSREMFHGLWPGFAAAEVPIGSVTNGVHHLTWIHPELLNLMQPVVGDSGPQIHDGCDWTALNRVGDQTLWSAKRHMRTAMIEMARKRLHASCRSRGISSDWVDDALDPNVLTFGFARRGASYKRLTLMLSDPERLKRLLNDPATPIQIVIAGKAHPADNVGKGLIQQMVQFADQEDVRGKIVFLPDYDISLARPLYPGCDVWMNNPLRPLEACGTSGMKAALNGAANLSVRDGWWDEWYDPRFGWEIPSAEGISDPAARDAQEAESLYDIIENEIVPKFYNRDSHGLPTAWLKMMRDTVQILGPKILASRMVSDYVEKLYTPAAVSSRQVEGQAAADLAAWKRKVRAAWPKVQVRRVESSLSDRVAMGAEVPFAAWVDLDGLNAEDVGVQVVLGQVDADDWLHDLEIVPMTLDGTNERGISHFSATVKAKDPGSWGWTVRAVPKNPLLASDVEMGLAAVAPGE